MTTRAEALAACLARGAWDKATCEEVVDSNMVGGVYCDGTIVQDARGKRCVTDEQKARRAATIDQEPLKRPAPAPAEAKPSALPWLALGALALGLYALSRK